MIKTGRVLTLDSLMVLISLSLGVRAEPPSPDQQKDQQIKAVVQDVFKEHGFSIDPSGVILIHEGQKIVVAMDISETLARNVADQIIGRLKESNLSFNDAELEVNLFGAAEAPLSQNSAGSVPVRRWNDVLSTADRNEEPLLLSLGDPPRPAAAALPVFSDDTFEKARAIILSHLAKIKESGVMVNTILMESYWKSVFTAADSPDLYTVGRPLVNQALVAGIRPYREGKPLNAVVFADLAMKAVRLHAGLIPTSPIIIRP